MIWVPFALHLLLLRLYFVDLILNQIFVNLYDTKLSISFLYLFCDWYLFCNWFFFDLEIAYRDLKLDALFSVVVLIELLDQLGLEFEE